MVFISARWLNCISNDVQQCRCDHLDLSTKEVLNIHGGIDLGVLLVQTKITIECLKKIALVAHGDKKRDLVEWDKYNRVLLSHHTLFATGTAGALLEQELGLPIHKFESGSPGRDQQIGAKIVDGEIDFLIFFWDPIRSISHDSDIKALLRMAIILNIPIACNRATADFMISSPLMDEEYDRLLPEYSEYRNRTKRKIGAN